MATPRSKTKPVEKKALPVKIERELYDQLLAEAQKEDRTLTAQLERVLRERYAVPA